MFHDDAGVAQFVAPPSDDIDVVEETARHGLVDHAARRLPRVAQSMPPGEKPDPSSSEAGLAISVHVHGRLRRHRRNRDAAAADPSRKEPQPCGARRVRAWHGLQPLQEFRIEGREAVTRIAVLGRVHAKNEQPVVVEAERLMMKVRQRPDKQPCPDQQDERQGDLHDHKGGGPDLLRRRFGADRSRGGLLQRGEHVDARGQDGRGQDRTARP